MRNGSKLAAVLSAAVLLAGPTLAQRPGGGQINLAGLLANPDVQKELKLTDEQIDKAKKVARDLREKYQDEFTKLRDAKPDERREKFQALTAKIATEAKKAMAGILKPEQVKRLKEIEYQQVGLFSTETHEALKLTEEQKKKLKGIAEETGKASREVIQNAKGNFEEAREKILKLRKEAQEKSEKLLNGEQAQTWKAMLGMPFELKMERRKKG